MTRKATRRTAENIRSALALRLDGKTYAQIGAALGFSRQYAQVILDPTPDVQDAVIARCRGLCEECGAPAGRTGHLHHRAAAGMTPETYNAEPNLTLLCVSCHTKSHAGPAYARRRHRKPSEAEKAANHQRAGFERGAMRLGISLEEYLRHRAADERWCSFHRGWELSTRFVRNKSTADGLGNRCHEANRAIAHTYYHEVVKKGRAS